MGNAKFLCNFRKFQLVSIVGPEAPVLVLDLFLILSLSNLKYKEEKSRPHQVQDPVHILQSKMFSKAKLPPHSGTIRCRALEVRCSQGQVMSTRLQ